MTPTGTRKIGRALQGVSSNELLLLHRKHLSLILWSLFLYVHSPGEAIRVMGQRKSTQSEAEQNF